MDVPKPTVVKDPSKVGAQRNDSVTPQVRLLKAKGKRCVGNNKKDGGAADVAGHTMDKRGRVAVRRSHNCPCRHRPGRSNISRSTSMPCSMILKRLSAKLEASEKEVAKKATDGQEEPVVEPGQHTAHVIITKNGTGSGDGRSYRRGGPPRQGPRGGNAGGAGGAALRGGRGGHRGGRGGNARAGAGRQARRADGAAADGHVHAAAGARGVPRRARGPRPRLYGWWASIKYANPKGLGLQEFEAELDESLSRSPRIDPRELKDYELHQDLLAQGAYAAGLIRTSTDGYQKMALSRKILLGMYLEGKKNTPEAEHWRKELHLQIEALEHPLSALAKSKKNYETMPLLFLEMPDLLPKQEKKNKRA
ncbi:uncharacterized protein [Triticum aestivum]|uniref:uncharacterized protein n=1 Tax=Triticum aestivum TaxID=4565 RepID=UPI001D002E35|nr:uncharacterized protein LOC123158058 [Triticum aestivum]